ncbi:MAG: type II toxin-antitoxin system VapC family toxin [Spirochaetaceae bacterium]|jgi:tRNA(fMet)-specific endonuclease VapC|nr:type II toxin-antitoxin system VapC family toxin [Spirochaetaceae bacterium]
MIYLLDTDISSYLIKENNLSVSKKFDLHRNQEDLIYISSITLAELLYGVYKRDRQDINKKITAFLPLIHIKNFNKRASLEYAKIRVYLESIGRPIGFHDMQIAACAKAEGAIIVTNNEKHFADVPGVKVENWVD